MPIPGVAPNRMISSFFLSTPTAGSERLMATMMTTRNPPKRRNYRLVWNNLRRRYKTVNTQTRMTLCKWNLLPLSHLRKRIPDLSRMSHARSQFLTMSDLVRGMQMCRSRFQRAFMNTGYGIHHTNCSLELKRITHRRLRRRTPPSSLSLIKPTVHSIRLTLSIQKSNSATSGSKAHQFNNRAAP